MTSMKILAFNSSTLSITSMVGGSIDIDNINIVVGSQSYDASGIQDTNHNGLWDMGETIFLYGLDLTHQTSVVVSTAGSVIMPSTVQWSSNPPPADPGTPGDPSTSYVPGLRMTTYANQTFVSPVSAKVADNVTYALASSGYLTNDQSWPMSEAGKSHDFSVKFEGFLAIGTDDEFEIRIMASDSVYVTVDGSRIIDITGSHGPASWSATTNLTSGYHTLEIGYQNIDHDAVIGELDIQKTAEDTWAPASLFYQESVNA
jgi:PA14 domain